MPDCVRYSLHLVGDTFRCSNIFYFLLPFLTLFMLSVTCSISKSATTNNLLMFTVCKCKWYQHYQLRSDETAAENNVMSSSAVNKT